MRMLERGVDLEAARCTVSYGVRLAKQYKGSNGGWVWKFRKEYPGEAIVVAAEILKDECWLVTAYKA